MTGFKRYNEGLNSVEYQFIRLEQTPLFTRFYINYSREYYYEKYDVLRDVKNFTNI